MIECKGQTSTQTQLREEYLKYKPKKLLSRLHPQQRDKWKSRSTQQMQHQHVELQNPNKVVLLIVCFIPIVLPTLNHKIQQYNYLNFQQENHLQAHPNIKADPHICKWILLTHQCTSLNLSKYIQQ